MAGLHGALHSEHAGNFRPRRRINAKEAEADLKDEELQRKLKAEMQQRQADKDMNFTPRESDSWLKNKIFGFYITINKGEILSLQYRIQRQSHHNFYHII